MALSDPTGTLASPLTTLTRRRGKRAPLGPLAELAREHGATVLVVGLPLGLDGEETPWCREVRALGRALGERAGLPVHFVDERFTSVQAEDAIRAAGASRKARRDKSRVDAAAAALILQRWLSGEGAR